MNNASAHRLSRLLRRIAPAGAAAAALSLLTATVIAVNREQSANPRTLTILYTSRARSQIRSCNCTKFRFGGYGRQATLVDRFRGENKNLILLEGGDFVGEPKGEQERLKADVAVKATGLIKYDALVPGEAEICFGPDFTEALKTSPPVPVIAANLVDKQSGELAFGKDHVICKTPDGLRVAITAVLDPELLPRLPTMGITVRATDPEKALSRLLPQLRAQADLVIVVAHASRKKARALADLDGIDIMLATHVEQKPVPMSDNNVVDAPAERIGDCVFIESRTQMGWTVGRLDIELDGTKPGSFTNRLYYLDQDYEESPEMLNIYADYNKAVRELAIGQQEKMRAKYKELLRKRGFDPEKFGKKTNFVTADKCRTCHQQEYEIWETSSHARALATLEDTNQQFDPECVVCHSTGSGKRGGFVNALRTPELGNVQCEACHGPGKTHANQSASDYGHPKEDTCRACHSTDIDPDFNYNIYWERIQH